MAILDMVKNNKGKAISLKKIAQRQSLSLDYLEQLFMRLKKAEIVISTRGANGGYKLTKKPTDISIQMIIDAVDDSMDATSCSGASNCRLGERCLAHNLWSQLNYVNQEFLSSITVADVLDDKYHHFEIKDLF